jgi:hypothetical protein
VIDEKPFKALLLDERDVFVALVEVEDADLTERHVDLRPHGGDCDRPVGEYRWNRATKALEPLPRQQRAKAGRPTLEMAVAFDVLDRWDRARTARADMPTEVSLAWLDDSVLSWDFKAFHDLPLLREYVLARGLALKKKD